MANENKLQDIIKTSLENIRNMVDSDTVIGSPIETSSGTTIIPVSKISVGLATGGLDSDNTTASGKKPIFGGGGGTGMSIKPVAFIVVYSDGSVELQNLGMQAPADPLETVAGFIDRAPDIVAKIKALFAKDKGEEKADESEDQKQ